MELTIKEAFIDSVLKAIEKIRPELLGSHTEAYHSKVPFPYQTNSPQPTIEFKFSNSTLDYDIRGHSGDASISSEGLRLSVTLNAAALRALDKKLTEIRFDLPFDLTILFNKSDGEKYPIRVTEAQPRTVQPTSFATLLSWLVSDSISRGTLDSGIPATINVVEGKAHFTIDQPVLQSGAIFLKGKLKA